MIEEAYCSFEIAKLLKEKGFDETCYACYEYFSSAITMYSGWPFEYKGEIVHNSNNRIKCPTHQMAMAWLREIFKLEIYPFHDAIQEDNNWWYRIEYHQKGCSITKYESESTFFSYEEAVENSIKYCLKNLI